VSDQGYDVDLFFTLVDDIGESMFAIAASPQGCSPLA
jgi:hypothetical protein